MHSTRMGQIQPKIRKAFENQENRNDPIVDPETAAMTDCRQKLQERLDALEVHLFSAQRRRLVGPRQFRAHRGPAIHRELSSCGGDVTAMSRVRKLQERLRHLLRYHGLQVREYLETHVSILYDVSLGGASVAQYVTQFTRLPGDEDAWRLDKYHLPLGFPLKALEGHAVMSLTYVRCLHTALGAQHERLQQLQELRNSLPSVREYHLLSGLQLELCLQVAGAETSAGAVLRLKYGPSDSRPISFEVTANVVTETSMALAAQLEEQLDGPLRRLPLAPALLLALGRDKPLSLDDSPDFAKERWQEDGIGDEGQHFQHSRSSHRPRTVSDSQDSSDNGFADLRREMFDARHSVNRKLRSGCPLAVHNENESSSEFEDEDPDTVLQTNKQKKSLIQSGVRRKISKNRGALENAESPFKDPITVLQENQQKVNRRRLNVDKNPKSKKFGCAHMYRPEEDEDFRFKKVSKRGGKGKSQVVLEKSLIDQENSSSPGPARPRRKR